MCILLIMKCYNSPCLARFIWNQQHSVPYTNSLWKQGLCRVRLALNRAARVVMALPSATLHIAHSASILKANNSLLSVFCRCQIDSRQRKKVRRWHRNGDGGFAECCGKNTRQRLFRAWLCICSHSGSHHSSTITV